MNVLSLFDGMSCGQIALERAGIKIDNYFASEVDKFAIQVTMKNYPNTIQLGDVRNIKAENLPKIDLLVGGSPCQGFSFAGKGLNFEDPRSQLFFEYVRLLRELKPKLFLLENVKMKKEFQDIISEQLGVQPIEINSALVSAQSRKRLYWTNIPNVTQPEDKKIMLKDIVDHNFQGEQHLMREKGKTLGVGGRSSPAGCKQEWDNIYKNDCLQIGIADLKTHEERKRIYSIEAKCPTLMVATGGYHEKKITENHIHWRKLTPIEYERLQTVPDNYTDSVSNTQRYRMLGNGWTVDVISHILSGIKQ